MSRVKVSNCQSCQRWINAKHEDWEIIEKEKVELIKNLNCEHRTNVVDYYDDQGDHVFEKTPKNFHTKYCTSPSCIPSNGRPNKIIYKSNGWGDEWKDDNHVCQTRNDDPSRNTCREGNDGCLIVYTIKNCPDCGKQNSYETGRCMNHGKDNVANKKFSHHCTKTQHTPPGFRPTQMPTNWLAVALNLFFILLPFILIFLVIRWLWRAGSKK